MKDIIANWVLHNKIFGEYIDTLVYKIERQQEQIDRIFKDLKETQLENDYLRFEVENPKPKVGDMTGTIGECIIEVNFSKYFITPTKRQIYKLNWEVKTFNKNTNKITTYSDFKA